MSDQPQSDYKEKFRPDADPGIQKQLDAELGEVNLDQLYGFDKPQSQSPGEAAPSERPMSERRGKVVKIRKDDVFVDLGGKDQGVVPLVQFQEVKIGDEFDLFVERYDEREGLFILGRKGALAQNVSWETLEVGQIVEGTVTGMNKGGLELQVKSLRAFMPAGQVDIIFLKDISIFLGQRVLVEVSKIDRAKKNLIVSRRAIVEREREAAKEKLMADLAEGQIRRGVVRSLADYGAFVDLGGVDGLIHVSEISHRRVRHPSELLKIDDLVDVKILKIDKETGKISLSLKGAMADPWAEAAEKYAPGTMLTALVSRIENFGAFLSVEEGIEGLLPVSEISYQRISHPSAVLKEGQTVQVRVLAMDTALHKLTFSLKQTTANPWDSVADRYSVDSIVPGKVTRTVDFGAFVELEPGLEGLVHISELANQRVRAASDVVKPGQEVKVKVLELDGEKRRVSLSIRRTLEPVAPPPSAASAAPVPVAPAAPKKKRPPLKGGLDSYGFFKG